MAYECNECDMESPITPCEARTCPYHGVLLVPKPDPATRVNRKYGYVLYAARIDIRLFLLKKRV
jgi:hypothetical protein